MFLPQLDGEWSFSYLSDPSDLSLEISTTLTSLWSSDIVIYKDAYQLPEKNHGT